jgi:hypothetical protein
MRKVLAWYVLPYPWWGDRCTPLVGSKSTLKIGLCDYSPPPPLIIPYTEIFETSSNLLTEIFETSSNLLTEIFETNLLTQIS